MSKELTPDNLSARTNEIVTTYLNNPTKTHEELAQMLGITRSRVGQVLRSPRVIKAYPLLAKRVMQSRMLPKALKRYENIIEHTQNEIVAERASARILSETGVFSDGKNVNVNVNGNVDLTLRNVSELRDIVRKAADLPANVIDAEIVDGE